MELHVKKLAGRKLVIEYLSSVCLFKGGNAFNISFIWKHSFVEIIINAMANGLLKTFAGSFISFGAILYIYMCISHYQYFLQVVLHHKRKLLEGGCFPL